MNYEQIKQAAYIDELEKVSTSKSDIERILGPLIYKHGDSKKILELISENASSVYDKNDYERVKKASFIDELNKIAFKNPAIAPMLSGMAGGISSAIAATAISSKLNKDKKNGITIQLNDPKLYNKMNEISKTQ